MKKEVRLFQQSVRTGAKERHTTKPVRLGVYRFAAVSRPSGGWMRWHAHGTTIEWKCASGLSIVPMGILN